jgi:hypothetical protein
MHVKKPLPQEDFNAIMSEYAHEHGVHAFDFHRMQAACVCPIAVGIEPVAWSLYGISNPMIDVNVSLEQLRDEEYAILRRYGVRQALLPPLKPHERRVILQIFRARFDRAYS